MVGRGGRLRTCFACRLVVGGGADVEGCAVMLGTMMRLGVCRVAGAAVGALVCLGAVPAAAGPEVTLIEAGAEPREALRFELAEGLVETMTFDTAMEMVMKMGGQELPGMDLPTSRMSMETTVREVTEDGYVIDARIVESGVVGEMEGANPMIVEGMREAMKGLVGTTFSMTMTDRGVYSAAQDIEIPAGANEEMAAMVESTMASMQTSGVAFPEEPVGVGARWRSVVEQGINGIDQRVEITYTLESIEGDVVSVTTEQGVSADPGPMEMENVPAGMTAELVRLVGAGAGEVSYRLSGIAPESMRMAMNVSMSMKMSGMGMEQAVDQQIKTVMTVPEEAGDDE